MSGSVYWSGYAASFVTVFTMTIVARRKDVAAGKPTSVIIDEYAKCLLTGLIFSFASWAMWVFLAGYIVIFAGTEG